MKVIFVYFSICFTTFLYAQNTIESRFFPPKGYTRLAVDKSSFGFYLQHLPLKPKESKVKYYNGAIKNDDVYLGVVDLYIGKKDLHQCADAVMRLRADYFFEQKQYEKIHFNFTNGFRVEYSKWRQGYTIGIKGNKTFWVKNGKANDSFENYWKYLETIFQYAGTASLDKELKSIALNDMQIGDVFIKGGFPGHAVIVVDMAINASKEKVFMLAQSYMPAQELQILRNPDNLNSPWFTLKNTATIETPEWVFKNNQLKRF